MRKGILILAFLLVPTTLFALEQNDKLWLAINTQYDLSNNNKWQFGFYSQFRLIKDNHPWQTGLFEGTLGYRLDAEKTLWLGYRWSGDRPNNGFFRSNRIVEQLTWKFKTNNDYLRFNSRTRFEEIIRSNENQIGLRLRERLAFEIKACLFDRINPYFFDEIFFQLNDTDYMSHRLIGENRIFLGFNWLLSKTTWWEIGYINQFLGKTPNNPSNQMSNILSLTYNF